jgi:hypothetical protein
MHPPAVKYFRDDRSEFTHRCFLTRTYSAEAARRQTPVKKLGAFTKEDTEARKESDHALHMLWFKLTSRIVGLITWPMRERALSSESYSG